MKVFIGMILGMALTFVGCKTIDGVAFNRTETALTTADGTPQTDAAGNQIYEATYAPSGITSGVVSAAKSLPSPFNWVGYGLGAALAGFCEWRRKRYVKAADGTITELTEQNATLTKALAALAAARDQLWDTLDQVDGGEKVIAWLDRYINSNAVKAGQEVLTFITDTLAKAETPDKGVATILTKLEAAAV